MRFAANNHGLLANCRNLATLAVASIKTTDFAYAEAIDGLNWTVPIDIGTFGRVAAYPTAVGIGEDPHILGQNFYAYFTRLPTDGSGWKNGEVRRLSVSCQ